MSRLPALPASARLVINLALLTIWIWLYRPVFQYLAVLFTREEFRTNQIVLAAVIGLLLYRFRKGRLRFAPGTGPRLFLPGLVMAMGGSLAYLLAKRLLDINTLSAFLFGIASYGLLGLWLAPERWRQGFPAMLLVVGVLPFGEHLETFVGYPLRIFTAGLVREGLEMLGFSSIGTDMILIFESGISQVDIPCSGVKSLWTGALFLLAVTWIENHRLSWRWLLVAVITGGLLISANLLRVAILALTGPALGLTMLAQMLHVPLGVLGFVGTCAAVMVMLGRLPGNSAENSGAEDTFELQMSRRPAWLGPLLVLCVLVMALAYTPRGTSPVISAPAGQTWSFPESFRIQPAPLSKTELDWIRQGGAKAADRYVFEWQNPSRQTISGPKVSGAVMLLTSQTWRGQHRPERCFEVFGLTVQESYTYVAAPDFPLRYLALSGAGVTGHVSAVYWLQTPDQTTEDFGKRIWADLGPRRERWVLVTVLFDREYDANLQELVPFFAAIHASVEQSMLEGSVP